MKTSAKTIPSSPIRLIVLEGGPTPGRLLSLNIRGLNDAAALGYAYDRPGNTKGIVEEIWTLQQ